MSLIFKTCLLNRGAQFICQSSSTKRSFLVSVVTKNTKQVYKPLVQARFCSSAGNAPALESRERIYDGTLHKKIRFVKIFSLTTSAGSLLGQPYLISKAVEAGSKITAGTIVVVFGFFAFVTPLLLHTITKRYIAHVDYNAEKDSYIATVYTIFARKKEIEFTPEDVTLPTMSDMLTSCMIKGKPMFMDVHLFKDVEHYKRIMGFDKPMNLRLDENDVKPHKD